MDDMVVLRRVLTCVWTPSTRALLFNEKKEEKGRRRWWRVEETRMRSEISKRRQLVAMEAEYIRFIRQREKQQGYDRREKKKAGV